MAARLSRTLVNGLTASTHISQQLMDELAARAVE
jgi:hypothetical protein